MTGTLERRWVWTTSTALLVGLCVACSGGPDDASDPRAVTQSTSVAVDAAALRNALDEYLDLAASPVRAVLVEVDGKLVVERYRRGDASEHAEIASVTKSFVSTLVGIALAQGRIAGLDQTLAELLPTYRPDMDATVRAITLRQLLTMTAGFPGDSEGGSPDAKLGGDWVRTILRDGVRRPPGNRWVYSSRTSHLLAAIVQQATGRPVLEYARTVLFEPLGIDSTPAAEPSFTDEAAFRRADFAWVADPTGLSTGFCCLKLTARDMLALGELFLADGSRDGRQVVPKDWVREATAPQVATVGSLHYGYQWWEERFASTRAYAAVGAGGQLVEVVPDLRTVVVVSTDFGPHFTEIIGATETQALLAAVVMPALAG